MAEFNNRQVTLNKPFRTPNKNKKFAVYVKDQKTGRIRVVRFGDPDLSIKKHIPARRRSFIARMGAILAKVKGQKSLSAAYWSMKAWR